MPVCPDPVKSSGVSIKREPTKETAVADEQDDPVVRTVDVYISPELATKLHLMQFPINPAATATKQKHHKHSSPEPTHAKFRPQHRMLELQYAIPNHAKAADRPLPDTMCLSSRTFTSSHISPATHMALAKLDKAGSCLDVIPMQTDVLQMRPSFHHLHRYDDDEDENSKPNDAAETNASSSGRQKPILYQKKESERSATQRRNSYAYKRASKGSEEWIPLDINTRDRKWTILKQEVMEKVKCVDRGKDLKLSSGMASNERYVKSLNCLDSVAAANSFASPLNEDLSEWTPSVASGTTVESATEDEFEDFETTTMTPAVGATEQAAAELAAKLAVLLQNGNGAMTPYRVLRSRLNSNAVPDEILTMALSSCAVLVRGNFCLKSSLAQFINIGGSGNTRGKIMRELRDLILLLLNMHGVIQRERLIRVYNQRVEEHAVVTPDTITFLLQTVAKKAGTNNCWIPKVEDDEKFAATFPEVASFHAVSWVKKKGKLKSLVECMRVRLMKWRSG